MSQADLVVSISLALFLVLLFMMGFAVVGLRLIVRALRDGRIRREMEESRREIAAYVAEGSITPEDAERLLRAGPMRADEQSMRSA